MSETTRLERRGSVYILFLGDDENRFSIPSLAGLSSLIDEVEAAEGPRALVTVGEGKFWSNGFDLDWLQSTGTPLADAVRPAQDLFARMLGASFASVAAIQGHCYGAGAMLALGHDVRIMREDRGFFCFPEVNIGMTFTAGMNALLASKLAQPTLHRAMVLGTRYTGPSALAAGIVDALASETDIVETAIGVAEQLVDKDPATLGAIKKQLYASTIELLRGDV